MSVSPRRRAGVLHVIVYLFVLNQFEFWNLCRRREDGGLDAPSLFHEEVGVILGGRLLGYFGRNDLHLLLLLAKLGDIRLVL